MEAVDQFIAGYGPLPADLALSETMDADRLAALLDRIGPAILVTHSASVPSGWLAADRRSGLLRAIVSIEPMGPPFADISNMGPLSWGLAAAPLTFDSLRAIPREVRHADPRRFAFPRSPASSSIVGRLVAGGTAAELLHLPTTASEATATA